MQDTLSDHQWQTFQTQGYVRLGPVIPHTELLQLQQRINNIMLGTAAVPYDRIMMQLDTTTGEYADMDSQTKGHKGSTLAYRKIQDLELDPLFLGHMQKPLFRHICERAYGKGTPISCFRAMFMNKPAHQGTKLPWHQDYFHQVDPYPQITLWLAMDTSTVENGCIKVLAESHRHYPEENHTVFLNEEQINQVLEHYPTEYLECAAGEALLLHNRLVHSSEVNKTATPRRAFSVCYMNGQAVSKHGTRFSPIFGEDALRPEEVGPVLC